MATIVNNWNEGDIREVMYKRPVRMLEEYHNDIFGVGGSGARFSERFTSSARSIVDDIKDSTAYRRTLSAFRKVRNRGITDDILYLHETGQLQHAHSRMQHVIMSEPTIRERWQKGRLAGFEESYNRMAVNRNTNRNTNDIWRDLNSSNVIADGDDALAHTFVFDDDTIRMSITERAAARQTQNRALEIMWEEMDDMTSVYNAKL